MLAPQTALGLNGSQLPIIPLDELAATLACTDVTALDAWTDVAAFEDWAEGPFALVDGPFALVDGPFALVDGPFALVASALVVGPEALVETLVPPDPPSPPVPRVEPCAQFVSASKTGKAIGKHFSRRIEPA